MAVTHNEFRIRGRVGKIKPGAQAQQVSVSIATDRKWKDKNGAQQQETDWHYVTLWGATADFVLAHQDRIIGQLVECSGSIRYSTGEKRYTNLNGHQFDVLTWPRRDEQSPSHNTSADDDDIPF